MKRLALMAVCGVALLTVGAQKPPPRVRFPVELTTTYDAGTEAFATWLFYHWKALGYKVPTDGETFTWSQYVVNVYDFNDIRPDDAVLYWDEKKKGSMTALVVMVDAQDKTTIVVMEPMEGRLIIVHSIPRSSLQGVIRPVHRVGEVQT